MKITNNNGQIKFIEPERLAYYETQGWSTEEFKAVLKPVKKAAQPKPAVDEVEAEVEAEIKEEVGNDNIDKGE